MKQRKLSTVFRRKLFKVTFFVLLASVMLILIAVPVVANLSTTEMLRSQLNDMSNELHFYDENVFGSYRYYFQVEDQSWDEESVRELMSHIERLNWYLIDPDGFVSVSNRPDWEGKYAPDDSHLNECWENLANAEIDSCYVKEVTDVDFISDWWSKWVGVRVGDGCVMVAEFSQSEYYDHLDEFVQSMCNFETVGATGVNIITRQDGTIVSPIADIRAEWEYSSTQIDIEHMTSQSEEKSIFRYALGSTQYYTMYEQVDGYYVLTLVPREEVMLSLNIIMLVMAFLILLLMVVIGLRVNSLTNRLIVKNISVINRELSEITCGNLDTVIDVRSNLEFNQLSDGINATVDSLKGYIAREAERFDQELELARSIQASALPGVFPPFPDRHDIDIFARMQPAKEVGGDFYDFFFTDNTHLVFLVADVSDKGIPAAMFMMKAKTIIKSLAQSNREIEQVITIANQTLCEDNSADMFVTLWCGVLDTATGIVSYVNAGHCKPLLRCADGEFEFVTERADFVLAGEESVTYHRSSLTMKKGDALFLYTDGVTEAVNTYDELFGEEGLQATLNAQALPNAQSICTRVGADIAVYSEDAAQTDDITMLALVFRGCRIFEKKTVGAEIDNLEEVYSFIEELLSVSEFSMDVIARLGVIADEICANIVRYAYPEGGGSLTVTYAFDPATEEAAITFIDSGVPFNPLNAPDPDIEDAENREEGGLGIFLVRKFSDKILYEYSDRQNILTIIKKRN